MRNATWALIGVSVLGFVLAVITALAGRPLLWVPAEAFSRACSNLALIAIALTLVGNKRTA
ncbi:MAG: hypothetical protein JSV80_11220 [Acidobacteriota bacterium]|nr:MAG: hypothetical protein JSV80_11220 [Acidobacteriota bacterium]